MSLMPFHLAIPVHDLPAARRFYGEVFGLSEGRSAEHWVDFDFFGHQLVIHQHPQTDSQRHAGSNPVDGHDVPVPHFGVVLAWDDWHALDERLGDLEHAFKPDLDGTTSAKPASPPPERFKLAPLGSVVRKKECATSILPDEQSSCAALEFCTDCAQ
ncbi:VOC family protein [Pseudomonas aeruginosa]